MAAYFSNIYQVEQKYNRYINISKWCEYMFASIHT